MRTSLFVCLIVTNIAHLASSGSFDSDGRRSQPGQPEDTPSTATPAKPSFLFLLIDDVGWADLGYNNGTAYTPNLDKWARRPGSIIMQDMHSK